ncbi:hypothetical protein B0H19DRAFT_1097917 [Mycena capillaripes]|nr:hypothetical protein B0H19DRAFT_1097917 [Mycena capillaripes]
MGEQPRDMEEGMEVDLVGPLSTANTSIGASGQIAAPAAQRASFNPSTPAPGHGSSLSSAFTPHSSSASPGTGSVFALPYRMLYAVVMMDTVAIYDTQQAGPVCLLTKLHYDVFTDLSWSPDGQCLMLASRDGYCTLVTFDEILPAHHTQQAALQLQQIAAVYSVPISYVPSGSQSGSQSVSGSVGKKRPLEPLTPAASVDGDREPVAPAPSLPASTSRTSISSLDTEAGAEGGDADEPPKQKRRVALARVGDL